MHAKALLASAAVLAGTAALAARPAPVDLASSTVVGSSAKPASPLTARCGRAKSPPATYRHVVWIWFENLAYEDIIGNKDAPFLNLLARQCGLAGNYHALTHPSLPNYIAATSGGFQGFSDNCDPGECSTGARSIFSQTSWRFYAESMPSNCFRQDAGPYAAHHNPPLYYTRLKDCSTRDVPLRSVITARFTFVSPGDLHDTSDSLAPGDRWLRDYLSKVLGSAAYRSGKTAIFITWDEDDKSHGNHVLLLVISPSTRQATRSDLAFDHYSLLRTTEQMLGLPCLGKACSARSLRSAFRL